MTYESMTYDLLSNMTKWHQHDATLVLITTLVGILADILTMAMMMMGTILFAILVAILTIVRRNYKEIVGR